MPVEPMYAPKRSLAALARIAIVALAAVAVAACGRGVDDPAPVDDPDRPSGTNWRTDLPVGANVDQVSFATPVLLEDGTTQTLEELAAGKPLLLYFFATWWTVCNAEFRTLAELAPDFEDDVSIVAVGFGSSQTVTLLNDHKRSRGFPGIFAEGPDSMARDFGVRSQSTKFGMTADGVIQFKHGYGLSSPGEWRERLQSLIDG